ncbi:MAG: heavy metal translocating P-type ATPase, partial [Acidimicrobiia bacterium]|nr:heavy metal translocating P-type ATPase [Acidimicrobiia bacterium]
MIQVQITAVGEDTTLAGIRRMVEAAQASNSRAQALADRAAAVLFYVAIVAAVITMLVWSLVGQPSEGVIRAVTVLIIACPHALGLAIPLVISISTAQAASAGILVKDRLALERMRTVDAVLFDKTGTLTKGNHVVVDTAASPAWSPEAVLALAGAVETFSEHPVAKAIVTKAREGGDVPAATGFSALTGRGVTAIVEGHQISVGGPALLAGLNVREPDELAHVTDTWRRRGGSVLHVVRDNEVIGAVTLEDAIRPESNPAVSELHRRDRQVVLITGDASQVAAGVAEELNIDEVFAEVLPQDKDAKVAELQSRGLSVAMVGDGVNDAPALARADAGLAIGAGTDVAIESAGVVLASSDPRGVVSVIDLSKATYAKMIQNLIWATGYNVLAIPVAAGALAPIGINLPPALAAVFMSLSTIIVAANAQLLRRLDLQPVPIPTSANERQQAHA